MTINLQTTWLFLLAIPIACVAWTVTHEEVFREPREYCLNRYEKGKTLLERNSFIFLPANIVSATTLPYCSFY